MRLTKFSFGIAKTEKIDYQTLNFNKNNVKPCTAYAIQNENNQNNILSFGSTRSKINYKNQSKQDEYQQDKDKYSTIKRGYGTKILGGGPIFPIPYQHEYKIIDIDNSFKEYKEKK